MLKLILPSIIDEVKKSFIKLTIGRLTMLYLQLNSNFKFNFVAKKERKKEMNKASTKNTLYYLSVKKYFVSAS